MKKTEHAFLKILLSAVFSVSLIASVFCITVSLCFSPNILKRRLEKQDFSGLAMSIITENMEDFQSVINLPTETLLTAIPAADIQDNLGRYTDGVNRLLLAGEKSDFAVKVPTTALEKLIADAITPAHYNGDLKQMEADRAAAVAEITGSIEQTLAFFPTSLLDKVTAKAEKGGFSIQTVYRTVRYIRYAIIPCLLLWIGSAVLLLAMNCGRWEASLRLVAGNWFITASVLFLPMLFLHSYAPLNRLSLSEGLLRQYILTLGAHIQGSMFTAPLIFFAVGLVFLLFSLYFSAKNTQSSCTDAENVVK